VQRGAAEGLAGSPNDTVPGAAVLQGFLRKRVGDTRIGRGKVRIQHAKNVFYTSEIMVFFQFTDKNSNPVAVERVMAGF
jgi:hypothetical protein